MFKFFKRENTNKINRFCGEIRATQDGITVPLSEVPDNVIKEGILGEGIAIIPSKGRVVSPVDGVVISIASSSHAFCIQTSDGVDVLVHIGVDTVALNGKGFKLHVKKGDYVLAGAPICDVNLSLLVENNLSVHTAILISNPMDFSDISAISGNTVAGVSTIIQYKQK